MAVHALLLLSAQLPATALSVSQAPASTDVLTVIAIYLSFPLVAAPVHPQLSAPPLATATSVCQVPANTDAPTVFAMNRTFSSEAINTSHKTNQA